MRILKLLTRGGALALLITVAVGGLRAEPARAERKDAPLNLALAPPPAAPRPTVLAETPRAIDEDAAPAAAKPAPKTVWWPWALIAAAAAGVGTLVFISSGKDPACPAGRTCK